VVIVNAQAKLPRAVVEAAVAEMARATRYNFEVRDGELEMYRKPADANVAIVLGERPDLPMSLVAAESCWGLLNVAPLATGDGEKNTRRFQREFARVAAFTLGQSCSQYKTSPLCAVSRPEDLDAIAASGLTFDAVASIVKMLRERGMTQTRKTSYRKACGGLGTGPDERVPEGDLGEGARRALDADEDQIRPQGQTVTAQKTGPTLILSEPPRY